MKRVLKNKPYQTAEPNEVVFVDGVKTGRDEGPRDGEWLNKLIRVMKKPWAMNGGGVAKKHTQQEWKAIQDAGCLNDELINHCPEAAPLNNSYVPHVYDFLYNYGSDSGNVPAC